MQGAKSALRICKGFKINYNKCCAFIISCIIMYVNKLRFLGIIIEMESRQAFLTENRFNLTFYFINF